MQNWYDHFRSLNLNFRSTYFIICISTIFWDLYYFLDNFGHQASRRDFLQVKIKACWCKLDICITSRRSKNPQNDFCFIKIGHLRSNLVIWFLEAWWQRFRKNKYRGDFQTTICPSYGLFFVSNFFVLFWVRISWSIHWCRLFEIFVPKFFCESQIPIFSSSNA